MAKLEFKGIDEYAAKLYALEQSSEGTIKKSVYEGARIIADAVKGAIDGIPIVHSGKVGADKLPLRGITPFERDGLKQGMGLASMKNENGYINTKLGFAGYNDLHTKKYPKGQPNLLIARSLERGSSAHAKHPFINKAVSGAKAKAEAAMAAAFDEELKNQFE